MNKNLCSIVATLVRVIAYIGGRALSKALLISLSAHGIASATVATAPQYLYFNAQCTDCALAANSGYFNVVATFVLDGYNYGEQLANGTSSQNGNIVSFSYSGSNMVSPFTALFQRAGQKYPPAGSGVQSINGQINTGLDYPEPTDGFLDIVFGGNGQHFSISLDGDWAYYAGSALPNDYGTGTWSLTAGPVGAQAQQVPEPGSLVLLGLSLAALGFAQVSQSNKTRNHI